MDSAVIELTFINFFMILSHQISFCFESSISWIMLSLILLTTNGGMKNLFWLTRNLNSINWMQNFQLRWGSWTFLCHFSFNNNIMEFPSNSSIKVIGKSLIKCSKMQLQRLRKFWKISQLSIVRRLWKIW